jgi:glucose/arabinose dehydrogenase
LTLHLSAGLNGIVFGDSRELYIPIGSNTNGGVPGRISSSQLQKENYYSAAVLVAYIHKPGFNGTITYDSDDDGTPVGGSGIEIFTSGNRNAFGIMLHSNGYLYVSDNGPNLGYGKFAKIISICVGPFIAALISFVYVVVDSIFYMRL